MKNFVEFLTEGRKPTLNAQMKKKIGRELPTGYGHHSVPLGEISDILKKYGITLIDSDTFEEYDGMILGRDGRVTIRIAYIKDKREDGTFAPIENSMLVLSWHKEKTFDVNCYLS